MLAIERFLVWLTTGLFERDAINIFFRSAENTAILVGAMIAIAGGMLGTFLLLRGMSLTSDAISHTVLLGIVVAFLVMIGLGTEPVLSSGWLLIGAAAAGVGTVVLTELIHRSGLVKQDAALGLAFPLLFALAVVFVSRYVDDVHLDADAVMVGEIGVAWANTNSYCSGDCDEITIDEDDPRAIITRQCTNCRTLGISPRDDGAEFTEICANCGTYTAAQAFQEGFTENEPELLFWPRSVTVMGTMLVLTTLFVLLFFKELKLSTFDPALAHSLGLRPGVMLYALMTLVSLVAVGAFDAVGSILVVAFFVIPVAAAYLLTDRLELMILLSGAIGTASAWLGYDLARGVLFGIDFGRMIAGGWDTSISAAMVVMMLVFFVIALLASPRYGLVSAVLRRRRDRTRFEEQVLMGHVYHHTGAADAAAELTENTLPLHMQWPAPRVNRVLGRLRMRQLIHVEPRGVLSLTERGENRVEEFWRRNLAREAGGRRTTEENA